MEHAGIRPASRPDCVFISHSSKDAAAASALVAALEERGISCWVAPRDVPAGSRYGEAIIDGINACSVLVLLLSEHSNASAQVLAEVERAVSKGLSVVTLRLEAVALTKSLEYFLSSFHWLDAFAPFEAHLPRLAAAIGQSLHAPARPSERSLPTPLVSASAPSVPNNLPQQATSFIGRETQRAEIASLLTRTRLLTLAGSGGTGKTRLSLEAAADALDQYADGVWFVELAPLSDPALVPQTVADVLSIREEAGKPLAKTLAEALRAKRLLLILDNCEHLLSACAALAAELIRSCPDVQIVASSREPLGVPGEYVYRVPSLALPDLDGKPTAAMLAKYEAARLFAERAQAVRPDFALTDGNALAVAEVCRRLDGIPLALELAAARVRSLSVEDVNARLDNRFRILTGGSKTLLPRQQTLKALIDWSYDLLTDQEKALLMRLSVFAGGWSLTAAEAVCVGDDFEDWEVLDLLTALVDKSLVVFADADGTSRYRLLETVRQYAKERLAESGTEVVSRGRHRDYFLTMAEEAEPHLRGPDQALWLRRLDMERDNLREALAWCGQDAEPESPEKDLRLCAALGPFIMMRSLLSEGRQWLGGALERTEGRPPSLLRMRLLNLAGALAWRQIDYAAAKPLFEASLEMARRIGDQRGIANALTNLGGIASERGDYAEARPRLEESLDLAREAGNHLGVCSALINLGRVVFAQGDGEAVRRLLEESLELSRRIENPHGIALSLAMLGWMAHEDGDVSTARTRMEESLALYMGIGDQGGIADALQVLAAIAASEGDVMRAGRIWGAVNALREKIGNPLAQDSRERNDRLIRQARAVIGDAAFDAAFAEGQGLTLEQTIAEALGKQ